MPQIEQSWRNESRAWRWLSRILCFFGLHHWVWSTTLKAAIACAVCPKKTKHWQEYRRRSAEGMRRSFDP